MAIELSYQLTSKLQGAVLIDVLASEARDLQNAREALRALWDIEELFSLFALSYHALEKVIAIGGLDYLYGLRFGGDDDSFFETLHSKIDLSILTLLTSFKSYDDQLPQRLQNLQKFAPDVVNYGRSICSAVYDSSIEYRIVYNLRNVVQHGQLALAGIYFGRQNQYQNETQKSKSTSRVRATMNPYILISDFLDSGQIQAPVRKEVADLNLKRIDIKQLFRYFAKAMSERHERTSEITSAALINAKSTYSSAFKSYNNKCAVEVDEIWLTVGNADGSRTETYLRVDLPNHIVKRQKINRNLKNAPRIFLSTEPVEDSDSFQGSDSNIWISK